MRGVWCGVVSPLGELLASSARFLCFHRNNRALMFPQRLLRAPCKAPLQLKLYIADLYYFLLPPSYQQNFLIDGRVYLPD